ncbi:hypothetical protein FRC19_010996 [Serendipita sp. 401]|nr:hypothetical protein FRC15_010839 [Serendipita sp. 397]KAG8795192.1 hypothetical protein FRC16_010190 [Serendipita sp. 398]KAG8817921.1 hypothetical protein FRC19_010996 [Serendipita sp. 401]KAG8865505.1 hypothetical protein FRC20_009759 [Serendipita sp. 405]
MLTCLHSPLHLTTSIHAFLEEIYAKREQVVDVRSLAAVHDALCLPAAVVSSLVACLIGYRSP